MITATTLYCPWEGDEKQALEELLAAILGPLSFLHFLSFQL